MAPLPIEQSALAGKLAGAFLCLDPLAENQSHFKGILEGRILRNSRLGVSRSPLRNFNRIKMNTSYLTPTQIAELLGVSTRTIRNLTSRGLLPVVRLSSKCVRYPREAVELALEKLTVGKAR